jgi:hypothetical protein
MVAGTLPPLAAGGALDGATVVGTASVLAVTVATVVATVVVGGVALCLGELWQPAARTQAVSAPATIANGRDQRVRDIPLAPSTWQVRADHHVTRERRARLLRPPTSG